MSSARKNGAPMTRNHEKLRVFQLADRLVPVVYQISTTFPPEERYALQIQVRRASVSVATNIVEGCSRETTREYLRFLNIALGSALETEYLLGVARRLGFVTFDQVADCQDGYNELARSLQKLLRALGDPKSRQPRTVGPTP
jgi:four helix bundle protein